MAGEWTVRPLEECMAAVIDYRGKTPQKTSFGIPLITAKVVKGGRIETPDEFIAVDDYAPWMRRGIPEAGDVVITTEAPLGQVAQLGSERVALAQRLIALRGKPGVLDNGFLKFLLQSADVQDQLRARASGTTVLGIKQSELRKVLLTLPAIDEQRAIAHILGTLDDKIELNRRMNETLEAMTKALFKSWFVNFDPVRAKAKDRDHPGIDAETAALFPDSFEDSALGEIPSTWRPGRIAELAELSRDALKPTEFPTELFAHYSIPAFDEGQMPKIETGDQIMSSKLIVPARSVLLSKLNPRFPRVWLPFVNSYQRAICSTEFLVAIPRRTATPSYLYALFGSSRFLDGFTILVTGTSGSHQRVRPSDLLSMNVVIPTDAVIKRFTSIAGPLYVRKQAALGESLALAALRDALLTKLMSGEVRVKGAERSIGVGI